MVCFWVHSVRSGRATVCGSCGVAREGCRAREREEEGEGEGDTFPLNTVATCALCIVLLHWCRYKLLQVCIRIHVSTYLRIYVSMYLCYLKDAEPFDKYLQIDFQSFRPFELMYWSAICFWFSPKSTWHTFIHFSSFSLSPLSFAGATASHQDVSDWETREYHVGVCHKCHTFYGYHTAFSQGSNESKKSINNLLT